MKRYSWLVLAGGFGLGFVAALLVLGGFSDEEGRGRRDPAPAGARGFQAPRAADAPPTFFRPETPPDLPPAVEEKTRRLLEDFAYLAEAEAGEPNRRLIDKLADVLQTNDESRRTLRFSLLLEAVRADDAPAVAEMFADLKRRGLEFHPEANFFAQRWGEVDPDAALTYVVEDGRFERGGVLLNRVMLGWASQAPEDAALWAMEQPVGPLRDQAMEGTATGWARTDPEGATNFVLALPDEDVRTLMARTVFWQVLYDRGIDAAMTWYDRLPESEVSVRRDVFTHLAERQLNRQDPAAAEWVAARQAALRDGGER